MSAPQESFSVEQYREATRAAIRAADFPAVEAIIRAMARYYPDEAAELFATIKSAVAMRTDLATGEKA